MAVCLPEGQRDLSQDLAISLRAAVNPLSDLNTPDLPQELSIQLTDGGGNTAIASTALNEPALQFPEGLAMESEILAGNLFTAPIPLTTVRMPLSQFSDVNLKNIQEIAFIFDKTTRGSLFIADIELISGQASE